MHIEFLIEEASAEAALQILLPPLLGSHITFNLHPFQGKMDMLRQLPARLRGYHSWIPSDWRIVVLLDRDNHDCKSLKYQLDQFAQAAGLTTRSTFELHVISQPIWLPIVTNPRAFVHFGRACAILQVLITHK